MSNKSNQQNTIKEQCIQCESNTNHTILHVETTRGCDDSEPEISWTDDYQIIRCNGCDTISFRHVSWFSEYQGWDSDGTTVNLYPMRNENTILPKEFRNIPPRLRAIYRETVDCYNNESFTLCAAGIRTVVEGFCGELHIIGGPVIKKKNDGTEETIVKNNLEGKINGLQAQGLLTSQSATMLHEHRFLENDALHELDSPSRHELALALEIIEHIITSIYEMPNIASELHAKRAGRTNR